MENVEASGELIDMIESPQVMLDALETLDALGVMLYFV